MTTSEDGVAGPASAPVPVDLEKLRENMARVEELSRRLIEVMSRRTSHNPALDLPDHELFARAAMSFWAQAMQNPAKLMEQQVEYWSRSVLNFAEAQQALSGLRAAEPVGADTRDRRFANPLWHANPYFSLIRQQYLTNAEALQRAVDSVENLDDRERRRLAYFTRQIIDMMAPTNFLPTNPDALQKALETDGESLVRGLENLVADLEANDGELVVRLADESAFEIGSNIATTPGEVVFRNRLIELIQYRPATDTVYHTPVVLFPPWINKFYILDLKAENSLVRWIVEQGYTLFVVSWVNPDASYADVGMEDYIEEGFLTAITEAKKICGVRKVNAVGYCIAGTTLALTLALMKQRGDRSVKSATFFTALTDFSDQGLFTPFLHEDFIDEIEKEVEARGVLRSFIMARTMSFLRPNNLVYLPAIRSYMLGETPPAFDLLYWNGDGTNLPARMVMQYLRGLCLRNEFVTDGFELMGHRLHVRDVEVPLMAITCESDHIAPWKDCYRGVRMMGAKDKTFIVSESGHVAGIVNPPGRKKYGHYTNDDLGRDAEGWMGGAARHEGSWWPRWEAWLRPRSGKRVPAREPGGPEHPPLCPAPGSYVKMRASH